MRKVLNTRQSDMYEPTPDTPLNTNSVSEADHANPSQTYAVIPTWGSDIYWSPSIPPQVGVLVETSKDWDSLTLSR